MRIIIFKESNFLKLNFKEKSKPELIYSTFLIVQVTSYRRSSSVDDSTSVKISYIPKVILK